MKDALKILVVDDDSVDRMAVRRSLNQAGVQIEAFVEADSAASAIAHVEHGAFDCAIVDYRLPDSDGINLVQQLRERQLSIALIVITGQGDERVAVELMKAGADDYIVKQNLTPEGLARSVGQAVRLHWVEAQAQAVAQQLRESEERYRLVLEGSTDGIWDWYIWENQVYCNDRMYEILGVTQAEIGTAQNAFIRLIHPDDQQIVIAAIRSHLHQNRPFEVEFRMRHASGEYRYCMSRGKGQRDQHGRFFRMLGVVNDITQRKLDEQRITELNRSLQNRVIELQTLLEVIPIGIAIAEDPNCDVVKINANLSAQLGIPPTANASNNLSNQAYLPYKILQNNRELLPHELPLQRAAATGETISGEEIDIILDRGEVRKLLGEVAPLFDEQGRIRGCIGAFLDITDRDRIEQSLRKAIITLVRQQQQLSNQNAILTAQNQELENQRQQIELQNLKLTEASQLKSQFVATMSHELRTPMNAIMGFSQLLLRKALAPDQAEMINRILNNSKNLLTLINDILDLSKIEAGRLELKPERFNLTTLLLSTIAELRSLAQQKELSIQTQINLENPWIINDSFRVRQILSNLLSNAVKFTDIGQITVRLWEISTDRIAIVVQDTGIGIAPENLDRIFEEFRQLDQSITRRHPGTGLGLAITKWLVEMMDGSISVESQLGEGSTFQVELPRELESSSQGVTYIH